MADFEIAVQKTLAAEGGWYHDRATGEYANRGITLATLRRIGILKSSGPATDADIEFVKSLTEEDASDIYRQEYWDRIGALESQAVADKTFDLQVNTGHGIVFLQRALGVAEDGILGPITAGRANGWNPDDLLRALKSVARAYYNTIAEEHPALAKNLPGWLARLDA